MASSSCSSRDIYEEEWERSSEESDEKTEKFKTHEQLNEKVQCMVLRKREDVKRGGVVSKGRHGLWKQEQKSRVSRLEKQLKVKWDLEELIEEQMKGFRDYYHCAMVPTRLKDVPRMLTPKWMPPPELAAISWLGDWRPSAILHLVRSLARAPFSPFSPSSADPRADSVDHLAQILHEMNIEEAIIDQEMGEIQATCVLDFPFTLAKRGRLDPTALKWVHAEFSKFAKAVTKAQQLRYKALDMAVKKVLNQKVAAEFLVAFSGIEGAIHQFASKQKLSNP